MKRDIEIIIGATLNNLTLQQQRSTLATFIASQMRQACKAAIADTKRAERRRAARIVNSHCHQSVDVRVSIVNEILGRRK